MINKDERAAVDLYAVLADDRVVEILCRGRTPAQPTPMITMLARWRDRCRAGTRRIR